MFDNRYRVYTKNGRTIHAPTEAFKLFLRSLLPTLNEMYAPHAVAFAYIKGKSYIDAARLHVGAKSVAFMDIKKFFNSTTFELVARYTSNYIASVACVTINGQRVLPQGSPLSPVLSNIVLTDFDNDLYSLTKSGIRVSRYADDIVISAPDSRILTSQVEYVGRKLHNLGYELNQDKTSYAFGSYHTIYGVNVGPDDIKPSRRLRRNARGKVGETGKSHEALLGSIK